MCVFFLGGREGWGCCCYCYCWTTEDLKKSVYEVKDWQSFYFREMSRSSSTLIIFNSMKFIGEGVRGCFLDPQALIYLDQGESFLDHSKRLVDHVESVLRVVQSLSGKEVEMFMIGKSSARRKKHTVFDTMRPSTWNLDNIRQRWTLNYAPRGYDGLIPVACILRQVARPSTDLSPMLDQQEYAYALESAVYTSFVRNCPEGIGDCWNTLNKAGPQCEQEMSGIVYVAYGFKGDLPRELPEHMQKKEQKCVGYTIVDIPKTLGLDVLSTLPTPIDPFPPSPPRKRRKVKTDEKLNTTSTPPPPPPPPLPDDLSQEKRFPTSPSTRTKPISRTSFQWDQFAFDSSMKTRCPKARVGAFSKRPRSPTATTQISPRAPKETSIGGESEIKKHMTWAALKLRNLRKCLEASVGKSPFLMSTLVSVLREVFFLAKKGLVDSSSALVSGILKGANTMSKTEMEKTLVEERRLCEIRIQTDHKDLQDTLKEFHQYSVLML